jgi:prolyl-tRNA synthetase
VPGVLTSQSADFPRWYQEVLAKATLAETGPVRGTMVIRPYGYAIWERIQAEMVHGGCPGDPGAHRPQAGAERFAGATATLTCEGMMRDGKALQLATSHELGQNFARAFDITYTDADGSVELCWTTSWGSSTRMVGRLIMAHGDDAGLRVPPQVAPVQVVLVVVKDDPGVGEALERLRRELVTAGTRVRVDDRTDVGLGRRDSGPRPPRARVAHPWPRAPRAARA